MEDVEKTPSRRKGVSYTIHASSRCRRWLDRATAERCAVASTRKASAAWLARSCSGRLLSTWRFSSYWARYSRRYSTPWRQRTRSNQQRGRIVRTAAMPSSTVSSRRRHPSWSAAQPCSASATGRLYRLPLMASCPSTARRMTVRRTSSLACRPASAATIAASVRACHHRAVPGRRAPPARSWRRGRQRTRGEAACGRACRSGGEAARPRQGCPGAIRPRAGSWGEPPAADRASWAAAAALARGKKQGTDMRKKPPPAS